MDAPDSFDVADFLRAASSGERPSLEDAELMYRGEPFPEWPYEDWSHALRAEVREARFAVLEALGQSLLGAGEPREAGKRFRELYGRILREEEPTT